MKLALIGDPVEHSRSPELQRALLRDAGIAGSYEAILVPAGECAAAFSRLRTQGYTGCNVTSPLKEEAARACDRLTAVSEEAGAVNTVLFGADTLGTNTDGIGAVAALREHLGGNLMGRTILVVGSGPTARAALAQLRDTGARVSLWARDQKKMAQLCGQFRTEQFDEREVPAYAAFCALPPEATLPAAVAASLARSIVVMDANYGERSRLAAQLGRRVSDGSRMLALQARASFEFWRAGG